MIFIATVTCWNARLACAAGPPSEPKKRNGRKLGIGHFRSKWRVRWDGRSGCTDSDVRWGGSRVV
eukprot:scaffold27238_cov94-Skeletonema_dohrnii-CCMP3373.AAC.2